MDNEKIEAILDEVCQKIGGDWLLVGGCLVQLEYDGARATEDIDLVHVSDPTKSAVKAQDELFKAAFQLGLDPESVNSAASFFVSELPGWEGELREWRHGPAGRVLKPSLTLFVALKLARGSDIDLQDIASAVRKEGRGAFHEGRFRALTNAKIQAKFDLRRARFGL
jgi:hypothetical protein